MLGLTDNTAMLQGGLRKTVKKMVMLVVDSNIYAIFFYFITVQL